MALASHTGKVGWCVLRSWAGEKCSEELLNVHNGSWSFMRSVSVFLSFAVVSPNSI